MEEERLVIRATSTLQPGTNLMDHNDLHPRPGIPSRQVPAHTTSRNTRPSNRSTLHRHNHQPGKIPALLPKHEPESHQNNRPPNNPRRAHNGNLHVNTILNLVPSIRPPKRPIRPT